ncbi:MAG: protoheme IX farnesyltransferase, partial [Anaerolineae bacterium]
MTGASRGCPDWPGCYGQLVPPMRLDSILEYAHRVMAALTSLFIVASAIAGWRKAGSIRWVSRPPVIAVALLLAVIIFGAMVVLRGLEPGLAALDLGSALGVLALMLTATVVAFVRHR